MRISPLKLMALLALLLGAWSGCGGAGSLPALIPVKGKVTYKGQPLTKGMVRFDPDGGYGRMATGELQADGTYVLTTLQKGDGVVAGQHKVFVTGTGPNPRKELVPKKYTAGDSSKLTADVDPEHTEFNFDLN